MIGFGLGLLVGLLAMWLYTKLVDVSALADIKAHKHMQMRAALSHKGNFTELLQIQKNILVLSFTHLRRVFLPALIAASPIAYLLVTRPEYATLPFGGGVFLAYMIAKWRFKL